MQLIWFLLAIAFLTTNIFEKWFNSIPKSSMQIDNKMPRECNRALEISGRNVYFMTLKSYENIYAVHLRDMFDVHPTSFVGLQFPNAQFLFFSNCDKNTVYYWTARSFFPSVKNIYFLDSPPMVSPSHLSDTIYYLSPHVHHYDLFINDRINTSLLEPGQYEIELQRWIKC